ncbi:hypothetical protein F4777DRAFT_459719 [Nemania sp. FL0916]|nr:hypothetical protein F4777DRAFT_459719 [Nemania sp. FL0916]
MTREKKKAPAPAHGVAAAARRAKMERAMQYSDSVWRNLNPLKAQPKMKHKSYYEAVENSDKKKKLEFEVTTDREPPPGFEFIPTGHPELSQECKEQSRNRDAMFFIVSNSKDTLKLDHHMNRLGYHFRRSIVEEARKALNEKGHHEQAAYVHDSGKPEPIPISQQEIDQEADAVLRDLFPRIPNTDRQEIIDHAFKKNGKFNGDFKVGMAKDITLARRVQLAALAHIRHNHTRYDQLLRESDWANARKAVEKPCLDIIVKWRGDEETGRDQLDEILREVIEISDSEYESEDEESSADNAGIPVLQMRSAAAPIPNRVVSRLSHAPNHQLGVNSRTSSPAPAGPYTPPRLRGPTKAERRTARKTQKRFKRYAAAAEALATSSNHDIHEPNTPGHVGRPVEAVRQQDPARPVNAFLSTPSAVTHEMYVPRSTTQGHSEIRGMPVPPNILGEARMEGVSRAPVDTHSRGITEQFIRVPDAQRPKVGPYSASHNHNSPMPPLSPVRLGLQDMLLPSIEPKSPDGAHGLHNVSQRFYRESKNRREITRTIVVPTVLDSRPRSPGAMANDDEDAAKRRRVITYFPEDFKESSNPSYVRVVPQTQDNISRHRQVEYISEPRPLAPAVPERVVYHDSLRTAPREVRVVRPEASPSRFGARHISLAEESQMMKGPSASDRVIYQSTQRVPTRYAYPVDAPPRSRLNPIIIDGDDNYGHHLAEEPRPLAHQIYRTDSPRGDNFHGPRLREDLRDRDQPRVIYVDGAADHVRSQPSNVQQGSRQFRLEQVPYDRSHRPLAPDMIQHPQPQARVLERPRGYDVAYNRNTAHINEHERTPLVRSGSAPREIQTQFLDAPIRERTTGLQEHVHRPYPAPGFTREIAQVPRDNIVYREIGPEVSRAGGEEYERATQQPFPVYPAPSSYVEIRGPPAHRRILDHRDVVYVE